MTEQTWKERFEKFYLEITDGSKWIKGKPVYDGYAYATFGNAIMDFIEAERATARAEGAVEERELIAKIVKELKITTGFRPIEDQYVGADERKWAWNEAIKHILEALTTKEHHAE